MVKVRVISRSKLEWTKDRAGEVPRAHRNFDPLQNPMAKQVEATRAIRAAKLDRLFAKPFLAGMGGHKDTVQCMGLDPTNVGALVSGGVDGQLCFWNAATKKATRKFAAHRHVVEGLCVTRDGVACLTASRDRTAKLWDMADDEDADVASAPEPLAEYLGESPFNDVDQSWSDTKFVTASQTCELWDVNRTRPLQSFTWGDETVRAARFNKVEQHLVACTMQDRGVCIYDTRTNSGHTKLIMEMNCTSICWNPMDPNVFAVGSDDWNCYVYDIRVTGRPRSLHPGHVAAVNSIDFSPTGKSFVAGSADSTIRIWNLDSQSKESAEMYHTKRMAKVWSVKWSLDSNYIFSGSEDAIIRIWKAEASKPIRPARGPEEAQLEYSKSLKERYADFVEVKRIVNQRNTPKAIIRKRRMTKRLLRNEKVKEMSRRKSTDLKPLAKRKVVQALK